MVARVRVDPAGVELSPQAGETVFQAALREGLTWPTICYGQARCTACALRVTDGHPATDPPGPEEQAVLRQLGQRRRSSVRGIRLACRLTVTGEVTVEKKGVKPTGDGPPEVQ